MTKYMANMDRYAPVIGRLFLGLVFVIMGISKIGTTDVLVQYATGFGVPLASVAVWVALLIELVAGLMLLVGFKGRGAAWVLAVYLVVVTLFFHRDFGNQDQVIQFLKTTAIVGGLLYAAGEGSGFGSVDRHKEHYSSDREKKELES
jgi:putative oxidoreductase